MLALSVRQPRAFRRLWSWAACDCDSGDLTVARAGEVSVGVGVLEPFGFVAVGEPLA